MKMKKVLVIDDDDIDLKLLDKSFSDVAPNVQVSLCKGSADAGQRILSGDADVVLLDINMPGLNGFEVLRQSRTESPGTFPSVIMLSSSANPADVREAYESGANAYLIKPSSIAGYRELVQSVRQFWFDSAVRPGPG